MINLDYLKFFAIGDVYRLKFDIDKEGIIDYCKSINFVQRENQIRSVSLTSIDGSLETAVDSGLKYIDGVKDDSFRAPTIHFHHVSKYVPFLNLCENVIGRTRIFKSLPYGVWSPHRDGSSTIRIIVPIKNCERNNFYFIYNEKLLPIESKYSYVVNTMKEHAAVVFSKEMIIMVINLIPNEETGEILTKFLDVK